ncbi:ADP-ribosylglycohydrolase family protein [Albidovulum sediminicola]|uniref:ADP-ribosylglycohydrolase family protein n=1 Tax=Albidovulum sediminicola TaxID=2984331 RepID=A0ABT2Z4P9_9RHOB|nr:ADP-ribosylglycohydrolase family protein [Defluviimonas sp. WL0075]MCV2866113.1 ADP-ribosylglycohydrolase family protein [Defluviimonas sp. WL0075]
MDRALGALMGVALGDALGMPSQTLPRARIEDAYGRISDLVDPFPDHPVSHGLRAGMVTDDTEQTLLLAELMIRSPERFDDRAWAEALLGWERDVRARGLRDLLGPSSKRALEALAAGAPASETGRAGTTNGAAMRIAPVGIATPPEDPAALVARVAEACRVTHNTREAIAAAAAVAMTISLGVEGATFEAACGPAIEAARIGSTLGAPVGEADIAGLILAALHIAERGSEDELVARIGTSVASREAVPAAFGVVVLAQGDPWRAGVIAANIGDDTDTIGAIACAMAGACSGLGAFPADKVEQVRAANGLDLAPIAEGLLAIRDRRRSGVRP